MTDTASLITLRSILDIEIARSYQWDAATIIKVSGVDRAGDLTTRIVENPGALADIAAVAQRYAYKGSQKWLAPKLEARFGAPQLEA